MRALALLAFGVVCCAPVVADVETLVASYEPGETGLTVTAGDTGLTVTAVLGGIDGAPLATDGDYVLRVQFVGEDGKVEFRHHWSSAAYDLAAESVLLADVYVVTSSALPGLMGIWDSHWAPPDAWQQATSIPTGVGVWTTVSFDVSQRSQTGLDQIWAFVLEDMPGSSGIAYVDNLRLSHPNAAPDPGGLAALARETQTELCWDAVTTAGFEGYNIYRSASAGGPCVQLNTGLLASNEYVDDVGAGAPAYFYHVTSVASGEESDPSNVVSAQYNGLTDDQLLDIVQEAAFGYIWDYAHPTCGAIRDAYTAWDEIIASGGTGMGLMAIVVGVERDYVTRAAAADRTLQILTFLEDSAERYHGVWPHWMNGSTGETIPFSEYDDGGDLVETSYVAQGLLTVRQYYDQVDPVEDEIRERATRLWEEIEWDWYRQYTASLTLYWHWSPNYGWQMNMPIWGYMETTITYLLAIASPTHAMPAASYYSGWTSQPGYANGNTYYGYLQWVGPAYGGPLFFTHYSNLGFDPRYKSDAFCNYYENSRNISLIHQAHAIANPNGFAGYNRWLWGLTASAAPPPWYYSAHSPTNDNGTVTPTAALSAMPYTPEESLATVRYLYDAHGAGLWGPVWFL